MSQDKNIKIARLISLEKKTREAKSKDELSFLVVNETREIIDYTTSFLLLKSPTDKFQVEAVSDIASVDRTAPLITFVESIVNHKSNQNIKEIEPIDLDKISFDTEAEYTPSFMSRIPTTLGGDALSNESYQYIHGIIGECIGQFLNEPFVIGQTWRNKYSKTDWQDPHIHSGAQWSFIIYVSVG